MFDGFVALGSDYVGLVITKGTSGYPQPPTSPPTYQVYSAVNGVVSPMAGQSGSTGAVSGDATGTLYSAAVVCSAANGFAPGELYFVIFSFTVGATLQSERRVFSVI